MSEVVPTVVERDETIPDQAPEADLPHHGLRPGRAAMIIAVIGLMITLSVTWTAWTLNRNNERRLLKVQTHQAAAVLSATFLSLQGPLDTAVQIESATGASTTQFSRFASTYVGSGRPYATASLWRSDGSTWQPLVSVGVAPLLAPSSTEAQALVARAAMSPTFVVMPLPARDPVRVGYALAAPDDPSIVLYVERDIPTNRVVPVESGSAFSDLDFATYLGNTTSTSALTTTDLQLSQLPITGDAERVSIPFGDSTVTLVAAPRGALGGSLGGVLPWMFLIGGLILTAGATFVTYQLVSRRRTAERDAETIATLYQQLDGLYDEQRSISETLQRALLPQRNPVVPNLEIASRYLAGADGVEVGGDWFSLIDIDQRHFAFAVGDVSGKGVDAAAIMARLRFTVRAYLTEGHPPDVVLEMCSRQLSVNQDGHMATVLVGIGDSVTGEVTVANAGHLRPLEVSGASATLVPTEVGLPLGVRHSTYAPTTVQLASGSTLVAFTDGLVERRGENIDIGLARLVQAAADGGPTVEDLLTRLTATLGSTGSDDDIAILGFRWTRPDSVASEAARRMPVD